MLVCHERKNSKGAAREAQTRGTNAIHGWRDTAVYLTPKDARGMVEVRIQHRGAPPIEPFCISVSISCSENSIESASVIKSSSDDVARALFPDIRTEIKRLIRQQPMAREDIQSNFSKRKDSVCKVIRSMIKTGECIEVDPIKKKGRGKKAKLIKFQEPMGTVPNNSVPVPTPRRGTEN